MNQVNKLITLLSLLLTCNPAFAQGVSNSDSVHARAEQMPEFKGGQQALYRYLTTNLRYPISAVEDEVQGKVMVEFTVCEDGKLCDEKVTNTIDRRLAVEALRVVRNMPPWKPGSIDGKPVKVRYTVPVLFHLQEAEPVKEEKK